MKWTEDKPTETGYYWYRTKLTKNPYLGYFDPSIDRITNAEKYEFFGPILPPEEEKK